jgi:hypothetical protein
MAPPETPAMPTLSEILDVIAATPGQEENYHNLVGAVLQQAGLKGPTETTVSPFGKPHRCFIYRTPSRGFLGLVANSPVTRSGKTLLEVKQKLIAGLEAEEIANHAVCDEAQQVDLQQAMAAIEKAS